MAVPKPQSQYPRRNAKTLSTGAFRLPFAKRPNTDAEMMRSDAVDFFFDVFIEGSQLRDRLPECHIQKIEAVDRRLGWSSKLDCFK